MLQAQSRKTDSDVRIRWSAAVAAWGWRRLENGAWLLAGSCPSCGHYMRRVYEGRGSGTAGGGASALTAHPGGRRTPTIPVRCNCSAAHTSGPAGRGCGQEGRVPFARLYVSGM